VVCPQAGNRIRFDAIGGIEWRAASRETLRLLGQLREVDVDERRPGAGGLRGRIRQREGLLDFVPRFAFLDQGLYLGRSLLEGGHEGLDIGYAQRVVVAGKEGVGVRGQDLLEVLHAQAGERIDAVALARGDETLNS
jgi:hypothetical protein